MMTKYFTGVGSRDITEEEYRLIVDIGVYLASIGYHLRSGGAVGSDTAFFKGVSIFYNHQYHQMVDERVYIPWDNYDEQVFSASTPYVRSLSKSDHATECFNIAESIHPAWGKCKRGARSLHARNVLQVLGDDLLQPSNLLVCCATPTKTGVKGGTNTAYMLAKKYNIPCFNIRVDEDRERILRKVNGVRN